MGIDISHKSKGHKRKSPVSKDPYLRLLFSLYKFLARRTTSRFNQVVSRRLCLSRNNRPPVSLKKVALSLKDKPEDTIAVVVSTVTNDDRLLVVPKMTLAALHVTESARLRIEKAGGKVLTLDQLAMLRPTGSKTMILQGARHARKQFKHFRKLRGRHAVPYIRSKTKSGRKHERARGRRPSRGFSV
ncbi:60S ribosomal protein L18-like [Schistocerca gregaria]|uniref:60S ribosomal protein L18-like n=1 Tax=Schistocerca gregaria TaxID=7010 RepID=UPI00211F2030|nr:60S ribosomal protein L18-like [Schistocerca gregaria]